MAEIDDPAEAENIAKIAVEILDGQSKNTAKITYAPAKQGANKEVIESFTNTCHDPKVKSTCCLSISKSVPNHFKINNAAYAGANTLRTFRFAKVPGGKVTTP